VPDGRASCICPNRGRRLAAWSRSRCRRPRTRGATCVAWRPAVPAHSMRRRRAPPRGSASGLPAVRGGDGGRAGSTRDRSHVTDNRGVRPLPRLSVTSSCGGPGRPRRRSGRVPIAASRLPGPSLDQEKTDQFGTVEKEERWRPDLPRSAIFGEPCPRSLRFDNICCHGLKEWVRCVT
jgi:hypothetical protein